MLKDWSNSETAQRKASDSSVQENEMSKSYFLIKPNLFSLNVRPYANMHAYQNTVTETQ